MTESAGELLFEACAHDATAGRALIRELAHHLGRLYGETIRACREHDALLDEVQTTFMCGMAISPNFGREEEVADIEAKAGADGLTHWHVKTSAPAGGMAMTALNAMLRDFGAEAREETAKPKTCEKCNGSGNMSQLGGWNRKCDACG